MGLDTLPDEIFSLAHLRGLNLGKAYEFEDQEVTPALSDLAPNSIYDDLKRLPNLPQLHALFLDGVAIEDLEPVLCLPNITTLDCTSETIEGFSALNKLRQLRVLYADCKKLTDLREIDALSGLEKLSLINSGISELQGIERYEGLVSLSLGGTIISNLNPLEKIQNLRKLDCAGTKVSDLTPLEKIQNLQELDCAGTKVNDLTPLENLKNLQRLSCGDTEVSDLTPLENLQSLREIDCARTKVSDLTPLENLKNLQKLSCWGTEVSYLTPLKNLKNLREVVCARTKVSDLTPLENLKNLRELNCSKTEVSDLKSLENLQSLRELDCLETKVSDLTPLENLQSLRDLDCSETKVRDLTPLGNLQSLRDLDCSETIVSDLTPLENLQSLRKLNCSVTEVSDLTPLENLQSLQALYCSRTEMSDLTPLENLQSLQVLYCSRTKVSDLTPLENLKNLQEFYCWQTEVSDLTPLKNLQSLRDLNCWGTKVSDLTPLENLQGLRDLDCSATKISDLSPLKNLQSLQEFDCSYSHTKDLRPLEKINLKQLFLRHCVIQHFPPTLWNLDTLQSVFAENAEIDGLPNDLFLGSMFENHLEAVRAHLDDLGENPCRLNDIKLMILGNGRIGKTQICNRIRQLAFEGDAESTHGITITQAPIPGSKAQFNVWDFGGQDLYHGTHALFLKSRAVFLLVWTPESDTSTCHEHEGMTFRNQPVSWWFDYVRRFGNENSPLIVIQNQLDRNEDRGDHPAVAKIRKEIKFCRSIAYSANTDEGRGGLDEHLKNAAKRFNPPFIGKGRLKVMKKLQAMRDKDQARSISKRRDRTINFNLFEKLCSDAGQITDPKQFALFLHNAGVIFWREGLFDNQLILDQAWMLDAIYTVFNRRDCYNIIRGRQGQFTRSELASMVWDGEKYSKKEQELFISFMRSSGICFELRERAKNREAIFVAPDLLPEHWAEETRLEWWGDAAADASKTFEYDALPPALLRNFIGHIGNKAGLKCHYWRNGFYGYDSRTGAKTIVEQKINDDWQGTITIEARGRQANRLLESIEKQLHAEGHSLGIEPNSPQVPHLPKEPETKTSKKQKEHLEPNFDHEPLSEPTYFVSYAWANARNTKEEDREKIVDVFCAHAKEQGVDIQRDKEIMQHGDRISSFIHRLSRGDRVIIVLSDKYLRSPFCMYELYEIWLQARGEGDRFLERIRVFAHEDAKIWEPIDRAQYAIHWQGKCKELDELTAAHTHHILGEKDKYAHSLMKKFETHIGDILHTVTDVLHPKTVDEFLHYSLKNWEQDDH